MSNHDTSYPMTPPQTHEAALHQVVLPFFDVLEERGGLQFGLPPRVGLPGIRGKLAKRASMSVLKLYDNGATAIEPHPILVNPYAESYGRVMDPPLPQWAWAPVQLFDGQRPVVRHARVVAPKRNWGSVPLDKLSHRKAGRVFYTQAGLEYYQEEQTLYDAPYDVPLQINADTSGGIETDVELCSTLFARVGVRDDRLLYVAPSNWALDQGLWTAHLLRLTWLVYGNPHTPEEAV